MTEIEKVGVLGAGVMGAAIAAHVANAGVPVVLLDIVPEGAENRNTVAEGAVARMLKDNPAPFMHRRNARLIESGNFEDDLDKLADCDWICEAVIENLEIKHDIYKRVDAVRSPGSIVSSNTSTIPLAELTRGMSDQFCADFAITHFFNPPRYMRLLELVGGAATRPDALAALEAFCDVRLGKEVVGAKDTPGFIGNRIGIYWSSTAMSQAIELGLSIEEADAIVGQPMGIPRTGIFGLIDLTGVDLAPHVNESMLRLLPADDAFCQEFDPEGKLATTIGRMIAEGYTGRKGKGGFYRRTKLDGKRVKEVLDFESGDYRPVQKARLASVRAAKKGLRALVEHEDRGGQYAWRVLSRVLAYAASLVPEIAGSIRDVDLAMKTGYAWKYGPFEQIDQLGAKWFAERLQAEGLEVPELLQKVGDGPLYKEEGDKALQFTPAGDYVEIAVPDDAWRLADKKRGREPIAGNRGASLWDVGDGVACLEIHTKMNAIDADVVAMIGKAAGLHKEGWKAVIVGNDADNFSVGANVGVALFAANAAMWPMLEQGVKAGQDAMMALKYAPLPVVAAPAGMALGGGCEIVLHADAVQAHAESYVGLVEVGVGIIPSWGGSKELITRAALNKKRPAGPMPPVGQAFETISTAKVARSAAEARDLLFLRPEDAITPNRNRLLADAKARALALVDGYQPPEPVEIVLPGAPGRAAVDLAVEGFVLQGKATAYDRVVATELANVVTGGDTDITESVSEKDLLALERSAFLALIRNGKTLARIEHMLETGRPLRN
ncbi:MAG TPA: 3-hydroxyacyl-CoA dehydrogenase NAD-binding domain-containing protein [Alphaproteobacteria bacterium]|jgi:3-hydroxyacyl-CoA dehydrogenase|nr:3-hydroxyacyl-CoA dehydrogenase NAD-binding domain-containing protein [Alphaproteobacteria bacterium]